MQLILPRELEQFVNDLVASGAYTSPGEVILEALLVLQDHLELERLRHDRLKKAVAVGLEQADRGELTEGETVFARLRERLEQRQGAAP